MAAKDTRLSLIKYTLNRIKHIKLFGWETVFQQKIDDARTREMKEVGRVVFSSASIVFFSNTLPILLVSVSFAWHLALGGGLPSSVVFPSLILFNNITRVATLSPQIILTYQGGTISYNRIRNFLMGMPDDNPDLHGAQYQSETHLGEISMENASFNRPGNYDDLGTAILNGCTFQAAPESLTVIRGVVGSGKSTFGRAILGEIKPTTGSVQVSGRIAYAPQKPFLINGSIRDNILFGLPFDGPWYEQVIEAVCLSSDFVTLQDGDSTLLEGTDTTLSGGQQSRVALARAIYSRRPLVVLDDPLAAVDVNVQRKIVENVLGIRGILKDRTRVVITSNKTLMKMANSVYTIANGTITLSEPTLLEEDSDCTPDSTEASIAEDLVKPDSIPKSPDAVHSVDLLASIPLTMAQGSQTRETDIELGPIPISVGGPETLADLGVVPVRLSTYTSYVKAGKPWAWPLVMLSAIICILFGIVAAFALQQVGQDFDTVGSSSKLTPYAICGVAGAVFSVVFILLAFFAGIIPASLSIHHRLMGGILMSRFSFFDTTPVGHILNRFTYDLNKVDGTVGSGLLTFIITGLLIIFSLLAIVVVTPSSALYLVPVIFIEAFLQSYYMHACRQLRRLEINARNPVLNVANEIKSGSAVILAYGQVEFFKQRVRDFIDQHVRVWMPFLCLNVWLQLRLHILTCTVGVLTAATLLYVDAPSSTLGLVMNFVIQVTGLLGGMVQILSNLEADLISFERVHRYTQNTPEDDSSSSLVDGQEVTLPSRPASTSSWPRDNSIEIENYSASYRSSTALCLQNINLSISSGEHIAVVGRTGAGKSSLALALMRAIDSSAVRPGSRIMIDGRNILADVSVSEVRSAISVIPQEPVVFTGTLRENLDPLNKRSDAELLDAILTCELPKALGISEDDSPLEYRVVDEG
jgi:ATP-binding cassette subfamily C (CFTR/MRP) protein 1